MSKQEDILFCKIAIQSGLVTQEAAQKCLGLAQRIEASGRPRPRIGSVFIKANVLTNQNVQRIYQAISKRMGSQGAPVAAAPAGRSAGARAAARQEKPAARRKPIDPRILWLGIGSGVACVVFGIIMVLMVINATRTPEESSASVQGNSSLRQTTTPEAIISKLGGAGEKQKQAQQAPPPLDAEARERVRGLLRVAITDARANRGDGLYGRAIQGLLAFQEESKSYLEKMPEEKTEIEAELKDLRSRMAADVSEKIQEAQSLAGEGKKDEAIQKLQDIRSRVDSENQAKLDGEIQKLQGGQ